MHGACRVDNSGSSTDDQVLRGWQALRRFAVDFSILRPNEAYFWAAHGIAEQDLFFFSNGKCYGIEVKFSEAPEGTRSIRTTLHSIPGT